MQIAETSGRKAEDAAARYLKSLGYSVVAKNWRSRTAEIDIIITKKTDMVFVEVKYRKNDTCGAGFEAITARKIAQMRRAANEYLTLNPWRGQTMLGACQVSGLDYQIDAFIECI